MSHAGLRRHVGAIHGRLLTAWSTAGVVGPTIVTQLRDRAQTDAIHSLALHVEPHRFVEVSRKEKKKKQQRTLNTDSVAIPHRPSARP